MYKKKIEKIVEDLHKELGVRKVPVPLESIIAKLNIILRRYPSNDFSGLLLRKQNLTFMGINSSESEVRQRFTMAHELGHFFLHEKKEAFIDYRDNNHTRSKPRTTKEIQANMFASAFLMPKNILIGDVKKMKGKGIFPEDVRNLARKYNVSEEAMGYRLMNIGVM